MNLTTSEILLAVAGWLTLTWLAVRAWDATRDWIQLRRLPPATPPAWFTLPTPRPPRDHCFVCNGALIGSERAYGTCGHCGGRSLKGTR